MAPEATARRFTQDERAYFYARAGLIALLTLMFLLDIQEGGNGRAIYLAGLTLLVVNSLGLFLAVRRPSVTVPRAMIAVLPFDLVAFVAFTYLGSSDDAFYAACILLPVVYALVVRKRQAWLVGAATASAYVAGHLFAQIPTLVDYVLFAIKALGIVVIGGLVASSVDKQRRREEEVEEAAREKEDLNEQLRRRVAELQAVSEITEIVHSSLEFDRVGPIVLDIVSKAIDIDSCCLFVIDKEKSETLFSASVGSVSKVTQVSSGMAAIGLAAEGLDNHFSCMPVFDHTNVMVLFCASADDIAKMRDEDRLVVGAVASELVVAVENSRLYKLTKRLAITDELTGLANYRHLQQRLDEEIGRAQRYGKNVSLLMIDADDFKSYNDTHGHLAGDGALSDLGTVLRANVREVDVVARYGGEEFSIILPETDAAGAYIVAEKMREAVSEYLFRDAEGVRSCHITVSVGLACYPTHAWDKESLLRESDDALYNAKDGGKNRVRTPVRRPRGKAKAARPAASHSSSDTTTGV